MTPCAVLKERAVVAAFAVGDGPTDIVFLENGKNLLIQETALCSTNIIVKHACLTSVNIDSSS